jgi:Flp pilus assembly CpaE family ATPase
VVVLDVPSNFDELYFRVLAAADQVVMIGQQTLPSVHDLKVLCNTLREQHHIRMPHLVINRYLADRPGVSADQIESILGSGRIFTIAKDIAGMAAAVEKGQPLQQAAPRSPAAKDLHALACALFPDENDESDRQEGGFLNWIRRWICPRRSHPDRRSSS